MKKARKIEYLHKTLILVSVWAINKSFSTENVTILDEVKKNRYVKYEFISVHMHTDTINAMYLPNKRCLQLQYILIQRSLNVHIFFLNSTKMRAVNNINEKSIYFCYCQLLIRVHRTYKSFVTSCHNLC